MGTLLGVSEAGYHAWRQRTPSVRAVADAALLKQIRTAHAGSGEIYGAPRVHATLAAQGARHGRKRIARLMREAGLVGVSRQRGGVVTTRRDREARPAPDLVDRTFSAEAPNQLWVGDITFVPTAAGFLYLAVVVDAYDNAMCESFFATLECELLDRRRFASQAQARMAVFTFIEGFYNPVRLHSALGYRSPIRYEQEMLANP